MNYLIIDTTANTGRMYIGEGGENCNLEENAMVFATEKEAREKIERNGWSNWASTMETDYPVNRFTRTEISVIREVIERYNEMVRLYPNKNTFYFSEKSKKDILKRELASAKFYMHCHNADAYGCFEIYELLINKLIPEDIVKNWVETNNGGSVDNDIIHVVYGFKPTFECELANTLEEAFENTQYCGSDDEYKIFFSKYIKIKQHA